MHSSRMRTTRLLTVSQDALRRGSIPTCTGWGGVCINTCTGWGVCVYPYMHWAGGVCIPACTRQGGVYSSMHWAVGVSAWGVSAQGVSARGCGRHPPREQND